MSRHHASVSHEVNHLLNEVRTMNGDDLLSLHGIIIEEDGSVQDQITQRHYGDLNEWANESVENDFAESFEHIHHGGHLDDY